MPVPRNTIIIISPAFPQNESETWWVPSQQLLVKSIQRQYPELNIEVISLLYPETTTQYTWHNCNVYPINGLRHSKFLRPLRWQFAWKQLKHIHQQQSVIGIISFWCGECAFIANRFARKHSLRHISWICGQDAAPGNKFPWFIRPRATELAAMSYFLSETFYRNHGVKPAYIISNAVDTIHFPVATNTTRDIDIAGAGSFEPLKRYPMWVELTAQLRDQFPHIKAIHYGMGVEKDLCEHLIHQHKLESNCFLAGAQPHEEILRALQRTKILLHTSRYEGCSTVCLEALYAGAKVISFCYPFQQAVPNWYVVNTKEEMLAKATELLQDTTIQYQSTLLHSMDESARGMMRLFAITPNSVPVQMQAYTS